MGAGSGSGTWEDAQKKFWRETAFLNERADLCRSWACSGRIGEARVRGGEGSWATVVAAWDLCANDGICAGIGLCVAEIEAEIWRRTPVRRSA